MTTQNRQTCLSAELLRQLSHDELSPAELEDIEEHLSVCDRCRSLLELAQSDPQWRDEIVPVLKASPESPPTAGDHDGGGSEGDSLESILRLLGPTDDPHMLGRIGSYEVVGVIGRGGMGVVFKAYEGALNRFVAIKLLLPHLATSGAARKRFAREGQAAAAVIDDNVMPIYSVAEWQGVPYLVTQYSRGATLQKRIQDQGPLDLKEILRIGMQTARGLSAAHAQGLVHRDVKPSNILLDGTVERALLTDFGLARAVDDASITRTGVIAGTPQYMSPEQTRGGSVEARSDLFGLGSVLYAMCTGHPPFRADSSYAILRMITDDEPRSIREINPDIPEWLCILISRLMAKSPDARFGGAPEVAELLERCLAHVQQPTAVPLPTSLSRPKTVTAITRRNTLVIGALIMVTSLALGLVAMFAWPGDSPRESSDQSLDGARAAVVAREAEGLRAKEPSSTSALEGIWAFVSIEEGRPDGKETMRTFEGAKERYAFEGKKLVLESVEADGKVRKTGEFDIALDTKVNPHRLTLRTTKDRLSIRYIYEVKDDTLRMCCFGLGEEDGNEVVAWPLELSIERDIEKYPRLQTLKRVREMKGDGAEPAPAAPKAGAVPTQPKSLELFPPFELRLAYFESGGDRTEYTAPGLKEKIYVAKQPFASIADVAAARAIDDASGQPAIEITFSPDSAKRVEEVTQQHLNKPLAILVDGKLLSAPTIRDRVGSAAVITGRFSREEAERIAQTIETAKKAVFKQCVSDIDAGPIWSEAVDGLQLAVSGIRHDRHFKSGDTIRFRLNVRNVGTEAIRFQYKTSEMCDWIAPFVETANGKQVDIRQMFFRGGHSTYAGTLEPNVNVPIHVSGILVLGASDTAEKDWPRIEKPEPGEYRLRARYALQRLDADGKAIVMRDANGMRVVESSRLTSGTVTFHID